MAVSGGRAVWNRLGRFRVGERRKEDEEVLGGKVRGNERGQFDLRSRAWGVLRGTAKVRWTRKKIAWRGARAVRWRGKKGGVETFTHGRKLTDGRPSGGTERHTRNPTEGESRSLDMGALRYYQRGKRSEVNGLAEIRSEKRVWGHVGFENPRKNKR